MYNVSVVGVGFVGSALASRIIRDDKIDKLILYDSSEKFDAVYKDLADEAVVVSSKVNLLKANNLEDILDSDIIVTTIKANYDYRQYAPEDLRVVGIKKDFPMIKDFAKFLKSESYKGKVLNISNPVDIVTRLISEYAEIEQVYGFGMSMDVFRAKRLIANAANVKPKAVNIAIIGEHGDTMVPLYSSASIYNRPFYEFNFNLDEIANKLRMHGASIVKVLGHTKFAPASAILEDLKFLLGLRKSTFMSVKLKDVFLGLPLYYKHGEVQANVPSMSLQEFDQFQKSYEKLKKIYENIKLSS